MRGAGLLFSFVSFLLLGAATIALTLGCPHSQRSVRDEHADASDLPQRQRTDRLATHPTQTRLARPRTVDSSPSSTPPTSPARVRWRCLRRRGGTWRSMAALAAGSITVPSLRCSCFRRATSKVRSSHPHRVMRDGVALATNAPRSAISIDGRGLTRPGEFRPARAWRA